MIVCHFLAKIFILRKREYAVSMATGMQRDKRSVDCLVLCRNEQDRRVSAESVTMRAMTLCKKLSGYRELLLMFLNVNDESIICLH